MTEPMLYQSEHRRQQLKMARPDHPKVDTSSSETQLGRRENRWARIVRLGYPLPFKARNLLVVT